MLSFITLLAGDVVETNSKYISAANSETTLKIATWDFKLNGTNDSSIDIALSDTISADNKYSTTSVIPGTTGMIPINIDCTNSKVALDYTVTLNAVAIPENLKFYTDETYTTEYLPINSFVGLNDTKIKNHNVYWKWEFTSDEESSNWEDKELVVTITVTASQRIAGDTA
jgi:hypothetical protein